jgi:hypothetical protein
VGRTLVALFYFWLSGPFIAVSRASGNILHCEVRVGILSAGERESGVRDGRTTEGKYKDVRACSRSQTGSPTASGAIDGDLAVPSLQAPRFLRSTVAAVTHLWRGL